MSRLTPAAYDELCEGIRQWVEQNGYVPPVRQLAKMFHCSPVTAWRIIKAQGWQAQGHHWVPKKKELE